MSHLVDLSHPVIDGMTTYPGLPAPRVTDHLSREASRGRYAPGVEFHIGRIDMVANTGTYVDVPSHRFAGGADLMDFPLQRLVGLPAVCVSVTARADGLVDAGPVLALDLAGAAVLLHTGWAGHWATDAYLQGAPYLDGATAQALVDAGAVLVGIDSLNIDSMADLTRPVHSTLLGHEIAIVEHLTGLDQLPREGFTFSAPAPAVRGMGTFTVRAFASVP